MSLRRFEIHFDEHKVKEYGKYSISQLYAMIDTLMEHRNIDKLSEGVYQAKNDSEEYEEVFGVFLMRLPNTDWFIKCADKFNYYYDDAMEDVLGECKEFLEEGNEECDDMFPDANIDTIN